MSDAIDTVRVAGGRRLATADAGAVRAAAGCAGAAGDRLRAAAFRAARAARLLEAATWHRVLVADARALAARLGGDAEECASLADRLLRAAGLYEQGESLVERAVGAAVGTVSAVGAFAVAASPEVRRLVGEVVAGAFAGEWLLEHASGGWARSWFAAGRSAVAAAAVTGGAPWSDEAVTGLGVGVAAGRPLWSGGNLSVTGGARVLSTLVHALLPVTHVRVREVTPPGGGPAWARTPSGSVEEALARVADLTGHGLLPGRSPAGVPTATLAVERVVHDDGSLSWTVLVPGTQDLVSLAHPFDGVTDLDLMAHRAADVTVAVSAALDAAGARPGEPVVLVGHSLGGIAAMALAASPSFRCRHPVGAVVTAGAPTASFAVPAGVPVLHLENDEELVSSADGRSGLENPGGVDRVTVTRRLAASSAAADRTAAAGTSSAHSLRTHLRTLALARESGSAQVDDIVGRIEPLLGGESARTEFYAARRVTGGPPGPPAGLSASSSGRTSR
ncbi:hypothetical protein [Xylanimonas sp. McL0601]|uniref:hypothetical protein n=1 Tax=Xylanimonas sp. McL0601 TaxID=3414739 RepID=UPI003CF5E898